MDNDEVLLIEFGKEIERFAEKNDKIHKGGNEDYNLLDNLTKHHLEELHSNFISDLLNPQGRHKQKSKFLKAFIEILKLKSDVSNSFSELQRQLNENLKDEIVYEKAEVNKEYRIRNVTDKSIYGRMDIFIHFPGKLNLVIENKIYAGEGEEQLERYAKYCKEQGIPFSVLYLTLRGDNSISANGERYVSISYKEQIIKWLENCLDVVKNIPSLKEAICFYKNMLEKRFLNSGQNIFMEEIKDIILRDQTRTLLKHQLAIKDALIPVRNYYRDEFFKEVEKRFKEKKCEFEIINEKFEPIGVKDLWYKKNNGILFFGADYVYNLESDKSCQVLIEHDWNYLDYGFVVVTTNGDEREYSSNFSENPDVKDIHKKIETALNYKAWSTKEMFAMKRFNPSDSNGVQLSFPDDRLNYEFDQRMNEIVSEFINDITRYLEAYKNAIEDLKTRVNSSI